MGDLPFKLQSTDKIKKSQASKKGFLGWFLGLVGLASSRLSLRWMGKEPQLA